jgi:hypothetical protein
MDADEQFRQEVGHLFAKLPLVPGDEIADVHSWGFAKDGRTFVRMLDTGGKTPMIQAASGERLSVGVL